MRPRDWLFDRLIGRLGDLVGRANLVRTGAWLSRAGRLDAPDALDRNGERLVQRTVARHAGELATVVDCGAHTGEWSAALLTAFRRHGTAGALRLHCFEPSAPTFEALSGNLVPRAGDRASIHLVRQALSARSGEAKLHVVHEAAGTNSLAPDAAGSAAGIAATEDVETTTLAAYARERGIARIDLLKIDVEGHDVDVLQGAAELIEAGAIDVIQFEYNQRWISAGRLLRDAFRLLAAAGYAIGKVTPRGIQWQPEYDWRIESFVQGNWVACLLHRVEQFPRAPDWLSGAE